VASVTYHDMFWYPFKGQQHINTALRSDWGKLFANWGRVPTDAEGKGYPNVGDTNAEIVRLGRQALPRRRAPHRHGRGRVPEVLQRKRRAAQAAPPA